MCYSFHDYSDGVNELINAGCEGPQKLGMPTFASREEFIQGQSTQRPIPFKILKVWHSCSEVMMRWRSPAPGSAKPEQEVTGLVVIETQPNSEAGSDQPFLMETVYSEFNSGAWLYDIGNFTASCTAAGTPTKNDQLMEMTNSTSSLSNTSKRNVDNAPFRSGFNGRATIF